MNMTSQSPSDPHADEIDRIRDAFTAALAPVDDAPNATIRAALAEPMEAQQQIVLDILAALERAMDPMVELQTGLNARGMPLPHSMASVAPTLLHLREIRRRIGRTIKPLRRPNPWI